jgi:hypothetical protein
MQKFILAVVSVISLATGGALCADRAQAAPLFNGLQGATPVSNIEKVQLVVQFHLGRRYCWYPTGWHGAGWYRCGYRWRRGLGWGGVYGWQGWVVPGWRVAPRAPRVRPIIPRAPRVGPAPRAPRVGPAPRVPKVRPIIPRAPRVGPTPRAPSVGPAPRTPRSGPAARAPRVDSAPSAPTGGRGPKGGGPPGGGGQ